MHCLLILPLICSYMWDLTSKTHIWCISGFVVKIGYYNISFPFSTRPPFIEIDCFHFMYDEYYNSFKARGLIGNNVMVLWSYEFNLDQLQMYKENKIRDTKFAFPQWATVMNNTCDFPFQNEFLKLIVYLDFFFFLFPNLFYVCWTVILECGSSFFQ